MVAATVKSHISFIVMKYFATGIGCKQQQFGIIRLFPMSASIQAADNHTPS